MENNIENITENEVCAAKPFENQNEEKEFLEPTEENSYIRQHRFLNKKVLVPVLAILLVIIVGVIYIKTSSLKCYPDTDIPDFGEYAHADLTEVDTSGPDIIYVYDNVELERVKDYLVMLKDEYNFVSIDYKEVQDAVLGTLYNNKYKINVGLRDKRFLVSIAKEN